MDWKRNGGDIAFKTMLELNKRGIDTELIVCGCKPKKTFKHPKLKCVGFLEKNIPEQLCVVKELYMKSTLFFLPTRQECIGLVFNEASAFGLPSVTTDTGGVSEYIEDGRNGFVLPYDAEYYDYADKIQQLFEDKDMYCNFCLNAIEKAENITNWDIWAQKLIKIIEQYFDSKRVGIVA